MAGRWHRDIDVLPKDLTARCRVALGGKSKQITFIHAGAGMAEVHLGAALVAEVRIALTARFGERASVGIYFGRHRKTDCAKIAAIVMRYGRQAASDATGRHRNTVDKVAKLLHLETPTGGLSVPCDAATLACGLGIVRTRERITGTEIADVLGVSTATLSRIEQGRGRGEESVAMAETERVLEALAHCLRVRRKQLRIRALLAGAAACDLLQLEAK